MYSSSKQKAYYLSTLNALILSIISVYLNIDFFYLTPISFFSQILCILHISYFTSFLFSDILLGLVFYKEHIGILTGYIHHFIYILINIYAIFTNNMFFYSLFFVSEIPTFILSIGQIHHKFRMNLTFGFTFFTTRILYHSFLIYTLFHKNSSYYVNQEYVVNVFIISSLVLVLHIYWFSKWVIKYL